MSSQPSATAPVNMEIPYCTRVSRSPTRYVHAIVVTKNLALSFMVFGERALEPECGPSGVRKEQKPALRPRPLSPFLNLALQREEMEHVVWLRCAAHSRGQRFVERAETRANPVRSIQWVLMPPEDVAR